MFKKIKKIEYDTGYAVGYATGYAVGYAEGKSAGIEQSYKECEATLNEQVARKATNMFCDKGYPNPLHVFDIAPSGIVYLNQEPITKEKAKELKSEASLLKSMTIWSVLQETLRQEAVKKAVVFSKNWEETLAGKMMLANLGIIKRIIDTISAIDEEKLVKSSGGLEKVL